MRIRKSIDVTFAVVIITLGAYGILDAFFPRLHGARKCDDDEPANMTQSIALKDAQSRASTDCSAAHSRCIFWIDDGSYQPAGLLRISAVGAKSDLFEGCAYKNNYVVYVYSRGGKFIRTEEAPYG